jgi:hypothetical protein
MFITKGSGKKVYQMVQELQFIQTDRITWENLNKEQHRTLMLI